VKVSIIIPVYNAGEFLNETLTSVLTQQYTNWEVVLVDDGSTDNCLEIQKEFYTNNSEKVKLLKSKTAKSGAAVCRNIGIKAAVGEFIIFLDADDLLAPFCLQQRLNAMQTAPELSLAVFKQYKWNGQEKSVTEIFNSPEQDRQTVIQLFLKMLPAWQTMAPIWKKDALHALGGFDEEFVYMEDPDLHLRALSNSKINFNCFYEFPADCFYRVDNSYGEKTTSFYSNSIFSRIKFIDKVLSHTDYRTLLTNCENRAAFRKGIIIFFKSFVFARASSYKEPILQLLKKLKQKRVFPMAMMYKLELCFYTSTSNSPLVKLFRLKGLTQKLLLN
jgi:glycosyltransferase involved in cell wall biosynthesis